MLASIRIPHPNLAFEVEQRQGQVPASPTDATSPVPSLSRSILSASDSSPNGWVTLELPRTSSPAHSPSGSSGKSDGGECAHVRFQETCLIIPENPMKSPGLAARMLGVGSWTTSKRRVSDPDREQSPLLGVRLPGLSRKSKHVPCESPPCAQQLPLRPCLVHRSPSQQSTGSSSMTHRPRLSTSQSTSHAVSSSLPTVLVRTPTRANSLPPPASAVTVPLRECCPDCVRALTKLDCAVVWSPGARRKRKEDRAEREREARAGLRDTSQNSSFGWEDMLAFDDCDTEESENVAGSSSKPHAFQRRTTSPPPSRGCGGSRAFKNPHALPCPPPRVCTEDDTDEEGLFPMPVSPRGSRSPGGCGKSPGKLTPSSTSTPSPRELCADAPDPAKCAEVIAVKCAEKAKAEVVVPAVRRLLEQQAFEGHRLSPVPGSEEPTPRGGSPTAGLSTEELPKCTERGRSQISKLEMAQVDQLPPQRQSAPPVSGSEIRPGHGRRRSSSASSIGRTIGAVVRGVAAGVTSPTMHM